MTTIQISLPDDLEQTARAAGLLAPEAIQGLLRQQLRTRGLEELRQTWAAMPPAALTPEIEQEIVASVRQVRAELHCQRQG